MFIHFGQFLFISVNVFKLRSWESKFCNKSSIFDDWLLSGRYLRFEKTSGRAVGENYSTCYSLLSLLFTYERCDVKQSIGEEAA